MPTALTITFIAIFAFEIYAAVRFGLLFASKDFGNNKPVLLMIAFIIIILIIVIVNIL